MVVEHRYARGTGGSVGTGLSDPAFRRSADGKAHAARYCAHFGFLAWTDRLADKAGAAPSALPGYRVSYILKTGANWRAPIGNFRVIVDKGAAENLVSFCAIGVQKISPSKFEKRRTTWRRDRDLNVLIVTQRH